MKIHSLTITLLKSLNYRSAQEQKFERQEHKWLKLSGGLNLGSSPSWTISLVPADRFRRWQWSVPKSYSRRNERLLQSDKIESISYTRHVCYTFNLFVIGGVLGDAEKEREREREMKQLTVKRWLHGTIGTIVSSAIRSLFTDNRFYKRRFTAHCVRA